jgi:hypothetical protein
MSETKKLKTKTYKVILLKMELKSFQWADGYYIVIARDKANGVFNLCQLDDDGKPQKFGDGRFMISCTGLKNKGVIKTNLVYREKYYE